MIIKQLSPLQNEILKHLKQYNGLTRRQLIRLTHKPRTTVYDNLQPLIEQNLVYKYADPKNKKGRPEVVFKITKMKF